MLGNLDGGHPVAPMTPIWCFEQKSWLIEGKEVLLALETHETRT